MTDYYKLMHLPDTSPRDSFYYHLCTFSKEHREQLEANPDVSVDEMLEMLSKSDDWLRANIAGNENMPSSVINSLLYDDAPKVRVEAITNPQTSFEVFKEAVLVDKYNNSAKGHFAETPHALKSLEIFETLWKAKATHQLIDGLLCHLEDLEIANKSIPPLTQSLIDFVNANLHAATATARRYFIEMDKYVTSEAIDRVVDNAPQLVVEAISYSPNTSISGQRKIFALYGDNYNIRTNIAIYTKDNGLLNEIYMAYPGKKSRQFVLDNPHFTPLSK